MRVVVATNTRDLEATRPDAVENRDWRIGRRAMVIATQSDVSSCLASLVDRKVHATTCDSFAPLRGMKDGIRTKDDDVPVEY
jgi:hypothetical protein